MDEEYQKVVNERASSNPWADFEPISPPITNNINNQRIISNNISSSSPNNSAPRSSLANQQVQQPPTHLQLQQQAQQPQLVNPFDDIPPQQINQKQDSFYGQHIDASPPLQYIQQAIKPQPPVNSHISENPKPTEHSIQQSNIPNNQITENNAPNQAPISQFNQSYSTDPPSPMKINPNLDTHVANTGSSPPIFETSNFVVEEKPQFGGFENIAWSGASSGLEDYGRHLANYPVEAAKPLNKEQAPVDNFTNNPNFNDNSPIESSTDNAGVQNSSIANGTEPPIKGIYVPKADTIIDKINNKKPNKRKINFFNFKKIKLKFIVLALLGLLVIAGISFIVIKFRNNSIKSTKLKSDNQIVAEDIIELAKNNKSDEIIKKYVRESNQASFPKDQFKDSVTKLSQASSGKLTYISENTAKVIVQPDTGPSDINAYIYTTNFAGYKGKIYIRVDVFKNSADGKWYLYALAYNNKELKPDLTAQPVVQ